MPKRNRAAYMREYRARKRQSAGEARRCAPESEAGDVRAVPEVPERFAATLRFLAGAPMAAAAALDRLVVGYALMTLAEDCGYTLDSVALAPAREAPQAP